MSRLRTLQGRLGVVYVVIAAAMLLIVYAVGGQAMESALVDSAAERLEIEAGLVVTDAAGGRRPTATDLAASDLATVLGGYGTAVVIVDGQGNVLASEPNGAEASVLGARLDAADYAAVIASGAAIHAVRQADGGRTLIVAAPVQLRTTGPGNGQGQGQGRGLGNQKPGKGPPLAAAGPANAVAQLAISLDSVDATVASVRSSVQVAALLLLVVAAAAVWLVTRVGLRPLERIAAAADRIAAGDLDARAALPGGGGDDEVGRLGRAFDGMAERVDATLQAQRAFAADASHELRSPLTVLGGYVDVLGRGETEPETRTRTLIAMRREVDRLSRLSADLLLLTQLEAGGGRLDPRPLDLRQLVEDIGEAARVIGSDRRVVVEVAGSLPVIADPDRITQAMMNLVDNALRHAPTGGTVRISAARSDSHAVVSVANDGTPIAPADLPRVFDRFFRADRPSDRENGHHAGLGLAIVKAIVEASDGTVSAASDETETRFSISLPAVPQVR